MFFMCLVAYKALSNTVKLCKAQFYRREFRNYLANKPNNILQYRIQIINLFEQAHITDINIPITQETGFGLLATANASVFANFPSKMKVFSRPISRMFENAIGLYRARIIESFNPLYWIDLAVFFPKKVLSYIGVDAEKPVIKLCNAILSLLWWAVCALATLYRPEIKQFLAELLGKL